MTQMEFRRTASGTAGFHRNRYLRALYIREEPGTGPCLNGIPICILKYMGEPGWWIAPIDDYPANAHLDFFAGRTLREAVTKLRLITDPS